MKCYILIRQTRSFLFVLLFTCYTALLSAQINAFVGYAFCRYDDNKIFNGIINRYNAKNPNLLSPMSNLKGLHGVDLGLRYRFQGIGIEFDWFNKLGQVNDHNVGTDNVEYKDILFYKNQSFCFGTEIFYEWFGLGASIDWGGLTVSKQKSTTNIKEVWMKQRGFSNHIYLDFDVDLNDIMSLSFRPYIQLPLYKTDYSALEYKLNGTTVSTADAPSFQRKVIYWGLKILFVNGTKSR